MIRDLGQVALVVYHQKARFGMDCRSIAGSAMGLRNALNETATTSAAIFCYDFGRSQKDAVRSGKMADAITQGPVVIDHEPVTAATTVIKGETLPATIGVRVAGHDKPNIKNSEIAAVLCDWPHLQPTLPASARADFQ